MVEPGSSILSAPLHFSSTAPAHVGFVHGAPSSKVSCNRKVFSVELWWGPRSS